MWTLSENLKSIHALYPQTAEARSTTYISLKNCVKAWAVISLRVGHATATTWTGYLASDVAATGADTFANHGVTCRWWLNADTAATDTLVEQTAAATFADAGTINKSVMIVIELDPVAHPETFDCFKLLSSASNASNITSVVVYAETKYQQANPPTMITD